MPLPSPFTLILTGYLLGGGAGFQFSSPAVLFLLSASAHTDTIQVLWMLLVCVSLFRGYHISKHLSLMYKFFIFVWEFREIKNQVVISLE